MKERILVFEDSEALRQSIVFILAEEGFLPIAATSLEEARTVVAEEEIAMMIADAHASLDSGTELVKTLTGDSTDHPIPVILFHNDLAGAFDISESASENVRFVTKPFSRDVLISAVNSFLL